LLIEQLRGSGISLKSDIWSFGNLIYFVVYAKGPYSDINLDTGNAHSYAARKGLLNELEINNRRPLFSDLEHSSLLYSRLHRIMQDCWALEPENRPSMNRVMHLLEKARYS
jgi:serine/threonine protein kinase